MYISCAKFFIKGVGLVNGIKQTYICNLHKPASNVINSRLNSKGHC